MKPFMFDQVDILFLKNFKKQSKFNWAITMAYGLCALYMYLNEKEKMQMRKRIAELEEKNKGE